MPDHIFRDGREVEINLWVLKDREWRSLKNPKQSDEEEYELISRVTGLSVEELGEVLQPDYQLLIQAIIRKSVNPVSDPN